MVSSLMLCFSENNAFNGHCLEAVFYSVPCLDFTLKICTLQVWWGMVFAVETITVPELIFHVK